jgi:hypothetical protein
MINEIILLIMFFHLSIFGDSGIVNGTDNKKNIEERISFIQNMSLSFDSFGILILLFNFGNLALGLGQELIKIYQEYQIKMEKE